MFLTSEEKDFLDAYRKLSDTQKSFAIALIDYERPLPHILQQSSDFAGDVIRLLAADGTDKSFLIRR